MTCSKQPVLYSHVSVWRYLNIAHPSSYNVRSTWNEEILHQSFLILNLTKQIVFHYKKSIHFYSCVSFIMNFNGKLKNRATYSKPLQHYKQNRNTMFAQWPVPPFWFVAHSNILFYFRIFDHKKGEINITKLANVFKCKKGSTGYIQHLSKLWSCNLATYVLDRYFEYDVANLEERNWENIFTLLSCEEQRCLAQLTDTPCTNFDQPLDWNTMVNVK